MSRGRLIVFEGNDGTGKSTLAAKLSKHLNASGRSTELLSFPGKAKGTLGDLVYRLHHDAQSLEIGSITPLSRQALHIAAHIDSIESTIIPSLIGGKTVVLDRYWWSTWAYGSADRLNESILDALINVEKLAWGSCVPNAIFNITRETPLRDEPMDMWHRVNNAYHRLILKESNSCPIHRISNDRALQTTLSDILSIADSI